MFELFHACVRYGAGIDITLTIIIKIIYIITFLWVDQWVCCLLGGHSTYYIINNNIHHIFSLRLGRFGGSKKKHKIHRNWYQFEIKYVITLEIHKIEKRPMGICNYIPTAFKWYHYHFIILNIFIETASSAFVMIRTTRQKASMNHVLTWLKSNWCMCTVESWKHRKNKIILTIKADFARHEFLTKKRKISL